jgi:hypothetical protein
MVRLIWIQTIEFEFAQNIGDVLVIIFRYNIIAVYTYFRQGYRQEIGHPCLKPLSRKLVTPA